MTYSVVDCLADKEIETATDKTKADEIAKYHGGSDHCVFVFEKPETVNQQKKPDVLFVNEPRNGELF